jgi:hypothetical protein
MALGMLPRMIGATATATFEASTFEEFDKGEPKGTLVSSEGEVVPGRDAKRLDAPSATLVFSSARGRDGTVYLGTGDQAHLFAAAGDKVRKVADLGGVLVTALTPGPGKSLLAGIMPDAKVVRVDPATGRWKQLAKLPTKHVWALLHDAAKRRIFVATGSPGKIYSIPEGGGAATVYYDPGEKHLLCLARSQKGTLLTGSSDKAILYEVTAKGRGRAVHDFDANELRDVVVTPSGVMLVAANKFTVKTSGLPRYDRTKDGEEGTPVKAKNKKKSKKKAKVRPQELRPGAKTGKGAVYRVTPDGDAEQLHALPKGYFTDLALDRDGLLWAADGTKGKVYLIRQDRTVLTAFDLSERQVLTLAVGGKEQYMGTGDAGAVYRIPARPVAKPAYLSEVFDAKHPSRWGNLRYQAAGRLRVESRSGNTAKPDKTWSGWKAAQHLAGNTMRIKSATARYLQLRFKLDAKAILRSFTAYHRPTNQRARISEITFEPYGKEKDKKKPRTQKIKIKWKVDNPDKDELVYRVYARQEMGLTWQLVSGHEPLEKTEYEWDTEPVPDGYYRIKVVASDERVNGPESTLKGKRISARLLVDNRKPEVLGLTVRFPWVSGLARDSGSPISRVEYSLDGKPWRMVDTADGLYDSPAENFRFRLPAKLAPGRHTVSIRAVDAAHNMGVTQISFIR